MPKTAKLMTSKGPIHVTLFPDVAPKTVANFEKLIKDGFYDGVSFHRVINDFMIQGGDPLSKTLPPDSPRIGTGGPGYTIRCEVEGNPQKHTAGSLSMAHAGKDTGGSQFFITHGATPHLNGVHTVFGRVVGPDDLKVVHAIRKGDKIVSATVSDA